MSEEERPDEQAEAPEGAGGATEQSPEDLVAEMARQLARIPVRDLALQTMATFADLAGIRMGLGPGGAEDRDMGQAKAAIEFLRAMIGVAESEFGAAQARPFREPLAQLQLLYARAAEAEAGAGAPPLGDTGEPPVQRSTGGSRLWTPPGSTR